MVSMARSAAHTSVEGAVGCRLKLVAAVMGATSSCARNAGTRVDKKTVSNVKRYVVAIVRTMIVLGDMMQALARMATVVLYVQIKTIK
jgi:hypothetical protein